MRELLGLNIMNINKMERKINSGRRVLIGFLLYASVSWTLMSVMCLWGFIADPQEMPIAVSLIMIPITALLWWMTNRWCSWVWIENGYIKRRGLLWGYKRQTSVKDVRGVKLERIRKLGGCLFLVDGEKGDFSAISGKSYIFLANTKRNRRFLANFWNGRVDRFENWKEKI